MNDIRTFIALIESLETNDISRIKSEIVGRFPLSLPPTMYHATKKKFLPAIQEEGISPRYYGTIHGQMEVRPPVPTVYFSTSVNSNNLNSNLFSENDEIVVLKIDTRGIDPLSIYPDDALFVGFGNEDVLVDEEDISGELGVSEEDASILLEYLEDITSDQLAVEMKFLWGWYVRTHGEISTADVIRPEHIVSIRDY